MHLLWIFFIIFYFLSLNFLHVENYFQFYILLIIISGNLGPDNGEDKMSDDNVIMDDGRNIKPMPIKCIKSSPLEQETNNGHVEQRIVTVYAEENDEAGLFGKGVAYFLRKLPARKQRRARIEFEELMMKYEESDD